MPSPRSIALLLCVFLIPILGKAQTYELDRHYSSELERTAKLANRQAHTTAAFEDYDVTHYRLDVTFLRPDTLFRGSVVMQFRSSIDGLSSIALNAGANIMVDSIITNGKKLQSSKSGDILTVTLPGAIAKGETGSLRFHYRATYTNSAIIVQTVQNIDLNEQVTSIASQAEPYDARKWWPCKDDPNDKADSVDLLYTVQEDMIAVGNGVLVSNSKNPNNTRTFHWFSRYPIVTYLVSIAAAKYNYNELTFNYNGQSMPVGSWYYGIAGASMRTHENTMLDGLKVFSDLFHTYPFINEKYGMAEYEWGGAMEHQTVSSMGAYGQDIVIHELAHQWFGDKVTCASFHHIWLNEGWATYCEALYREAKGGFTALKAKTATTKYFGPGTIYVSNPNNFGQIFNSNLSYRKASWVLHMLRHIVGDDVFFRAVKKYLGSDDLVNYRSVKTEEFQQFLETESGKDLNAFFQNWLFGEYFPTYKFTWKSTPASSLHNVDLTIEQVLSPATQIFEMPIDVYVDFGGGRDTTIVVQNDKAMTTYSFQFASQPVSIQLDKDDWILKRVIQPVQNPTFDKGILIVNGVDWDVSAYTDDIKAAYADSTFTGNKPFTFWDIFPNPSVGYPANLQKAVGSGSIPSEELGKYCTIVWIGNAFNGDEAVWQNTSIWEYVKAGGNVVLIARSGRQFITTEMQQLLGLTWAPQNQNTIQNCVANQTWLREMTFTGEQSLVAPFNTALSRTENLLLFRDTQSFANPVGTGVWGMPTTIQGKESGNMIYMAFRPYRIDRMTLRENMQEILNRLNCEVATGVEIPSPQRITLTQNYPNPIHARTASSTMMQYTLPEGTKGLVTLQVVDVLGRVVATPVNAHHTAGAYTVQFDASKLPAGVYSYRLSVGNQQVIRSMTLIR